MSPQPTDLPPPSDPLPNNLPSAVPDFPEGNNQFNPSSNYPFHSPSTPSQDPTFNYTPNAVPPLEHPLDRSAPHEDTPTPGAYLRTETLNGFIYTHPTAGQSFGEEKTKWEVLEEVMRARYPGNPWGMWQNRSEWQIARWMATKKVSQGDLDDLLSTEMVSIHQLYVNSFLLTTHSQFETSSLSFRTAKELFDRIEHELRDFSGPAWHSEDVTLGDAPLEVHTLYYRKVEDVGDYLMGLPMHQGKLSVAPVRKKELDDKTDTFDEMCLGTAWNDLQVRCLPYFERSQAAEADEEERT